MYSVETKVINQAVVRNFKRFPDDFVFRINHQEFATLRSHFVTSSWGGVRQPCVFTEQGFAMLAGVLNGDAAQCEYTFVWIRRYPILLLLVLSLWDGVFWNLRRWNRGKSQNLRNDL